MNSPIRSTAQLARHLGVSRWTVSRALNGHPGIAPATVERIKETARRHGFAPSVLGRGLRSGRTDLVGICLPDLVDYFLTAKIALLQRAFQDRGLHPILQIVDGTRGGENAALERFAAMRCAGVITIASRLDARAPGARSLADAGIPTVRIDPMRPGRENCVSTDRRAAMIQVVRHLHQLGHRRLVAAGISGKTTYGAQRVGGLKAGCRALGWNFARDIAFLDAASPADDFAAGAELAAQYLKKARAFPAIVCLNDRVAVGLMQALAAAGLGIPEDVSVIGYDNADFSAFSAPPLTTVDPQVEHLIRSAVGLLLDERSLMGKRSRSPGTLLVRRASDGPPPSRGGGIGKKAQFSD